jgi:hypothetical protein
MEAKKVEITVESQSKPIASFQCKATGNFIFELRSRSSRTGKMSSKGLENAARVRVWRRGEIFKTSKLKIFTISLLFTCGGFRLYGHVCCLDPSALQVMS